MTTQLSQKDVNPIEKSKESKGPENLKVYIRVRPRLKTEFLKETAAFVDPIVYFFN